MLFESQNLKIPWHALKFSLCHYTWYMTKCPLSSAWWSCTIFRLPWLHLRYLWQNGRYFMAIACKQDALFTFCRWKKYYILANSYKKLQFSSPECTCLLMGSVTLWLSVLLAILTTLNNQSCLRQMNCQPFIGSERLQSNFSWVIFCIVSYCKIICSNLHYTNDSFFSTYLEMLKYRNCIKVVS